MFFNSFPEMKGANLELEQKSTEEEIKSGGGGGGGDVASIEAVRRPRGRPRGSKNKPKPPVIITREADPSTSAAMRPHVLEIAAGHDVADCLARFSRRRNLGVCVLAGTGAVANVTLRGGGGGPHHHTAPDGGGAIVFRGTFEILSISATILPPSVAAVVAPPAVNVSVSMVGPQGQLVGGTVVGPLVAAGTVVVVAAAFTNPTFHRLPPVDDDVALSVSGEAEADRGQPEHDQGRRDHNQQQRLIHRHDRQATPVAPVARVAVTAESCGVSMYSCRLPADVMWAPTAVATRPPPPPPPPPPY